MYKIAIKYQTTFNTTSSRKHDFAIVTSMKQQRQ